MQSTPRSNDELRSWLKINHLLEAVDDTIIEQCIEPILKLFYSKKEILLFLIQYTKSTTKQLDDIYHIIKEVDLKQKESKQIINNTSSTLTSTNLPYFDRISNNSISNICDFLTRDDITNFKATSRRIGIECLETMNNCLLSILNINKLINNNNNNDIINDIRDIEWRSLTSFHRYHPSNTYSSIFQYLEKYDSLPQKYQLPIIYEESQDPVTHTYTSQISPFDRIESIHSDRVLLIFDKRNITILDSKSHRKMKETDVFNNKENQILILYYFDVCTQQLIAAENIIIDRSVTKKKKRLIHYIEKYLIFKFNKFNNSDDPLSFHLFDLSNSSVSDNNISALMISVVFQINGDNNELFWRSETQFAIHHLQPFSYRVGAYLKYQQPSNQTLVQFVALNISIDIKKFETKIYKNIRIETVKQHLSQKAKENISHKNIELYYKKDNKLHILQNLNGVFNASVFEEEYTKIIFFERVSYDTTHYQNVYKVQLFPEYAAPFPFNTLNTLNNAFHMKPSSLNSIKVKFSSLCTIKELVDYLMKLSSEFDRHIQISFANYLASPHPLCYAEIYGNIRQLNDEIDPHSQRSDHCVLIKLYMIPNEMDKSRNIELLIRFSIHGLFDTNTNINNFEWCLPGLPLVVFINESDTVQDIMNNNQTLVKYKDVICDWFRIDGERVITLISDNIKRRSDAIVGNILRNPRDFVVITLNTTHTT